MARTRRMLPPSPTYSAPFGPFLQSSRPRSSSGTITATTTARSPPPWAFRSAQSALACAKLPSGCATRSAQKRHSVPSHLTRQERCLHGKSESHMPIPERRTLSPGFERQLRAALDRVDPPSPLLSNARFKSETAGRPRRLWRLAPALAGIGAAGIALTAVAATGSPDPSVWTQRAASAIESVGHIPAASPKAVQSPKAAHGKATPAGQGAAEGRPTQGGGRESDPSQSSQRNQGSGSTSHAGSSPNSGESSKASTTPHTAGGAGSPASATTNDH